MARDQGPAVNKALFVRLRAKPGKESEVEAFLRDALSAVTEEEDTPPGTPSVSVTAISQSSTHFQARRGGLPTSPARSGVR